ncbi:MAG: PASTA domain-containing protein, partial [Clostridia bacterium]|nr:PASTA domain-containing protein [Clostridia bacterium]
DIKEGDTIEVYVSQGPKPSVLTMPNCQNMLYNEAKARLNAMGITSITVVEVDSEKAQGTILSQEPALGTEIDESTTIKFTISNGTAPTGTVKIEFDLPAGLSSQSLRVEITIDGETVYTENVNTSEKTKISASVTGAGSSKEAKVYLAGALYETVSINFTTGEIKKTTLNPDYTVPTAPTAAPTQAPEG